MVTLNPSMVFFILVLLESGGVITEKQRKDMVETSRNIPLDIPLSDASSKILDMIKRKRNKS